MPKVYVATSFKNLEEARDVMSKLEAQGWEITHNWTHESAEGLTGDERLNYLTDCAEKDFQGVMKADLLFLINDPRAKGAFTEFGIALARHIPVIVAKKDVAENIFFHMKNHIWAYEQMDAALEKAKSFHKLFAVTNPYIGKS